jgi:CheY-like chemotaxis protein
MNLTKNNPFSIRIVSTVYTVERKILYVDDDRDDGLLLRQAMIPFSFVTVQHAFNGQEALGLLGIDKLNGSLPDLIVLDINMPGMNGMKVLEIIKKDSQLKGIPVVMFTTAITDIDQVNLNSYKVDTVLKPTNWTSYKEIAIKMLSYVNKNH